MKKSFVCSLIGLSALMLAGCGVDKPTDSPVSDRHASVEPEKITVTVPVDKTYVLSVPTSDDYLVELPDGFDLSKVVAGSTVSFSVIVKDTVNKKLSYVKVDGLAVVANDEGVYSFVMPNKDVAIEVAVSDTGASEIFINPDVDETVLPETYAKLKENLAADGALESKYVSNVVIEDEFNNIKYEYVSGESASLTKSYSLDTKKDNARPERAAATVAQNGIVDGYFYSIKAVPTLGTGSGSGTMTETASTLKIVADDAEKEYDLRYLAKESVAKAASTSFYTGTSSSLTASSVGANNYILSNVFAYNNYFDDGDCTVTSVLAEDKKSYTATATWTYYSKYNKTLRVYESVTTFDGLGLVANEEFSEKSYAEGSYTVDGDNYTVNDDAVASSVRTLKATLTRGVKNDLSSELKDIHDYVLDDYDIHLQYSKPEKKNTYYDAINGDQVENGGILRYTVNSDENCIVTPAINSISTDLFKYTSINDITAIANGAGVIQFDNGLGVMKDVPVEVIDAIPTAITPTIEKKAIYVGDKTKLTATVAPAVANQDFTVTAASTSVGEIKATKNDDGSYDIEGVKEGAVTLDIASVADPTLVAHIDMNVLVKPDKDTVTTNLTTKTVRFVGNIHWGSSTTDSKFALYINFNSDGTGTQRAVSYSYGAWSLQAVKSFSYTMDDSFNFTFSNQETKYYIMNFEVVGNDNFNVKYYGPWNYTNIEGAGIIDRIDDLSTLTKADVPEVK